MDGVIYSDKFVTIIKEGDTQRFSFHPPRNMGEKKTMSKFLHYFAFEVPFMSNQALIDLITMAYELCNDKLTIAEQKFLMRLNSYDRITLINTVWNRILAGEGLSMLRV